MTQSARPKLNLLVGQKLKNAFYPTKLSFIYFPNKNYLKDKSLDVERWLKHNPKYLELKPKFKEHD